MDDLKKVGKNKMRIIKPYLYGNTWVFDDENTGLIREPFVEGADKIIDVVVKDLEKPEEGFYLIFSADPFPNYKIKFNRENEEYGGWWYSSEFLNMRGWLCPALFLYFDVAPLNIYIKVA